MDLNLREISYFLRVVELGSLGSAAATLTISQPALSRALKRLEEKLGGTLFVRHTLGMDLTAFGEAFLPHARILRADATRTIEDIGLLTGAARGVARIGIVPSAASYLLPPVFENALRASPDIQINVVEAPSTQLVAELEHGKVDFAIAGALPAQNSENITISSLLREELCIVCRQGHPLAASGPSNLSDLLAYRWIMPEYGNAILMQIRKMFLAASIEPPRGSVSSNSVHTLRRTVAESDFLTILPAMAFRREQERGTLQTIEVCAPRPYRDLSILRRAARPLLPATALVLTELRAVVSGVSANETIRA